MDLPVVGAFISLESAAAMPSNRNTVTVVCTANICRSPMAAEMLQHALRAEPEPVRSLEVVSAGIAASDGDPPSEHSVRALEKVGLTLDGHRSRRLTRDLLEASCLVLVMTKSHRSILREVFPEVETEILLFREPMSTVSDLEIPDPFGADLASYEACRDSMVEAIPSIVAHLKTVCGANQ